MYVVAKISRKVKRNDSSNIKGTLKISIGKNEKNKCCIMLCQVFKILYKL